MKSTGGQSSTEGSNPQKTIAQCAPALTETPRLNPEDPGPAARRQRGRVRGKGKSPAQLRRPDLVRVETRETAETRELAIATFAPRRDRALQANVVPIQLLAQPWANPLPALDDLFPQHLLQDGHRPGLRNQLPQPR